ncbi:MAG TPA: hypothetical protein VEL05_12825, partial [Candidatus Acidoferrum sp.]|nr:hypothetical protein [Candidatus Acidoferrum sp.]
MLRMIWNSLRTGVVTTRYPDEPAEPPAGFRGAPEMRSGAPFAGLPAPAVCPSGAIRAGDGAGRRYSIDLARCIFCGRCETRPSGGPIQIGRDFELASRRREALLAEVACDAEGRIAAVPAAAAVPADGVAEQIRRTLGRS